MRRASVSALLAALLCCGCMSGGDNTDASSNDENLTVGTVQRKIAVGMSGAEVLEALGSPNVVSTDEQRREVWVYDKISTKRVASVERGAVGLIFFGYSRQAGESSTSQRTLTVIVKFDKNQRVRDFAYHSSRF